MSQDDLALLRTLARGPVINVPANCQDRIVALAEAGYAVQMPEGWITTALGCAAIEDRTLPLR